MVSFIKKSIRLLLYSLIILLTGILGAFSQDMESGSGDDNQSSSNILIPEDYMSTTLSISDLSSPLMIQPSSSQFNIIPSSSIFYSIFSSESLELMSSVQSTINTSFQSSATMMTMMASPSPSIVPLMVSSISDSVTTNQPTTLLLSSPIVSLMESSLVMTMEPFVSVTSMDQSITPSPFSSISSNIIVIITTTSTISSSSTSTVSVSVTPTETTGVGNILDQLREFFQNTTITLIVAIGGSCIILLLLAIIIFCCCCCCRRRKGRYSVEGEYNDSSDGGGRVTGNRYKKHPTISEPIPSYKMALRNVQEQRRQIDDFVETEMGPDSSVDDNIHYQGHSQVQHSQPYSPLSDAGTTQSLSKLTPFNPSQIISQARGGISVDDDDDDDNDEEIPEKEDYKQRGSRDHDGADSPFMHLSDNLTGSRSRVSQRSTSDSHTDLIGQPSQASQYSHLGLGVLHGGDVVFTNTASLAEDMHNSLGMIGIDQSLLLSKESDMHSYRTTSPLLHDTSGGDLDDTPVREKSVDDPKGTTTTKYDNGKMTKNLTSLTSLTSVKPTKLPRSSTPTDDTNRGAGQKLNLSSITALSTSGKEDKLSRSTALNNSDLQETPERHRRHTIETTSAFKRPPVSKNPSKLGKLTSLEFIRASLRMRLNRIKGNETADNDIKKKPLKSALRKPSVSNNSQNSSPDSFTSSRNNSFVYSNHHAHTHYNDMSPQHQLPSPHYPPQYPPDPYMRPPPNMDDYQMMGIDGYPGQVPGMYPPGPGYPRGDPYMMLSPQGYAPEPLSPILSVSQFDHPGMYSHEIGILPQYGGIGASMMGGSYHDQAFPPQPPHYDDDDDDGIPALHSSPYRHGDQGGGASQRNVSWNLNHETVEIPVDPENLTPSDIVDDL